MQIFTFCIVPRLIYTMSEAKHIQLASKLADIPLFIAQSRKSAKLISSFEHVLIVH
ncbi:hypothetical protein BY458DRAFT_513657 [Sporodiniella umbellata]|nr:hypothetical protein BY458DRAFT_513657 [Sporodiniella umbellata]